MIETAHNNIGQASKRERILARAQIHEIHRTLQEETSQTQNKTNLKNQATKMSPSALITSLLALALLV